MNWLVPSSAGSTMNRAEAVQQLEHMRELERAKVAPDTPDAMRKLRARRIAALNYALEELHRMEGLEK